MTPVYLVLNSGSSSLKFQVFAVEDNGEPRRIFRGLFERLGGAAHFQVEDHSGTVLADDPLPPSHGSGHDAALRALGAWLREHRAGYELEAVGHRVVHGGMRFDGPVRVDQQVLTALEALAPLAPLHQPHNLAPIRILRDLSPDLPQVACFDTAFHRRQPEIAQLFALPRAMTDQGVRRYGFHGLSYAFLSSTFGAYDARLATGRVVAAHLGNGASLCAMRAGKSIATTMGFSALDGLPMGTRCGDLDAGVVFYMLREMKLGADEAERLLYTQAGLLGVSGLSNDMRTLRDLAEREPRARLAIDLFVYRIGRELGSLIAALGGIDALVFTAGIGVNDAATRREVLDAAAWAGFTLDAGANATGGPLISKGPGPAAWVIPTDEELMIAREMHGLLEQQPAMPRYAN